MELLFQHYNVLQTINQENVTFFDQHSFQFTVVGIGKVRGGELGGAKEPCQEVDFCHTN